MISVFRRNKDLLLIPILFIVLMLNFKWNILSMDENKKRLIEQLMNSVLSFSSLSTAFLFFTVSFIPVMAEKSKLFVSLKTDSKLLERIMMISLFFFLDSIMSLVYLFIIVFDVYFNTWWMNFWISINVYAIWGMVTIFYDLLVDIRKDINNS